MKSKNRANQVVSDRFNVRCLRSLSFTLSLALALTFLSLSCVHQCAWTKTHPLFVCQNGCYLRATRATHALPLPLCSCHAHNFYMLIMRLFAVLVETGRGRGKTVDGKVLFTYALSFYLRLPLTWRAVILLLPLPFLLAHFVIIACLCMCVCVYVCIGM